MKSFLIDTETLKRKQAKGLCKDLTGFADYSPVFCNYSGILDTETADNGYLLPCFWPDWKKHLQDLVKKGVYIKTPLAGKYLYALVFADGNSTERFTISKDLKAIAASLFVKYSNCEITTSPDNGGPMLDYLALLESFMPKDNGRKRKSKAAVKPIYEANQEWRLKERERQEEEEHLKDGDGVCESGCGFNGESEPISEPFTKESSNEQESEGEQAITLRGILEEWAKPFQGGRVSPDDSILNICIGTLIGPYLKAFPVEERKARFEEIVYFIPRNQHPERFRALFEGICPIEHPEPFPCSDDEIPW